MKALCVSLVLTTSLLAFTGAAFLAWSAAQPRPQNDCAAAIVHLEERFTEMRDRIQNLETDIASLGARVTSPRAQSPAPAGSLAMQGGGSPSSDPAKIETVKKPRPGTARDAEGVRELVYQFIQEEREERQLAARQEALARAEDRQREIAELYQGPYGDFNYRVNVLASKLEMNDQQKLQYYNLLTDYTNRIEDMRRVVDRNNPEVYAAYRDRKKQVQEEFEGLVAQSLTPPQAKAFQDLPFSIRSAAIEAATGKEAEGELKEVEGVILKAGALKTPHGVDQGRADKGGPGKGAPVRGRPQ